MYRLFFTIAVFLFLLPAQILAAGPSFVTVVNPIRGQEFWEIKNQQPSDAVLGQVKILQDLKVPATWLIRFDALEERKVTSALPSGDEKGLFLEITPGWAQSSGVKYRKSEAWYAPGSVFLTGYELGEREKLIDVAFERFKQVFGFYPKSVGGWWVDSYSLGYMQKKYGVAASLIVADQYTTDNYQIWGQYWGVPYYPSKVSTLRPAQTLDEKLPVVVSQWAARDPINGYGRYVENSTYSVQVNDYLDYHLLTEGYFARLIDIYTVSDLNRFGQVVVGLENSYTWEKYKDGYGKQIKVLDNKRKSGQLSLVTMEEFASWYGSKFKGLSPEHLIVADDPLGSEGKSVWFMNPYYRVGWFYNKEGSVIRDVRQYVEGDGEPCLKSACDKLNFATFSTRVLDEVTYGKSVLLDKGKIKGFKVTSDAGKYVLSYGNELGQSRMVEFLPRDISIDGKVSSIDTFILQAANSPENSRENREGVGVSSGSPKAQQLPDVLLQLIKFILFIPIVLFIPGFLLVKSLNFRSRPSDFFLSVVSGMVMLTLAAYIGGLLKLQWLTYIYVAASVGIFIFKKYYLGVNLKGGKFIPDKFNLFVILTFIAGAIFQSLSLLRSGWVYDFGIGFWGPLGHDGIWHQALINQLIKQVPPQNPVLSGEMLTNYHYFFDLLVAETVRLSQIPVMDLLYRFYPFTFSILLGLGTYILVMKIAGNRIAALTSLYFVYFAGSFGWIVEFLRERHFGGESAFWVNQPVSMNLNPPFAISLLIIIAIVLILGGLKERIKFIPGLILVILIGTLMEFKVYGGVIVLAALFLISLGEALKNKNFSYLKVFIFSILVTALVFLPQNAGAGELLVLSPFWFVHSMIDFPDRVGWLRLGSARDAYFARGERLKYLSAEALALGIFIIGNLGLRFIGLFPAISGIRSKFGRDKTFTWVILMSVISLLIPLLFIQKGNPWNTIQFMYYFLFFLALFSGSALVSIFKRVPKIPGWLIVGAVLILTPINAAVTFRSSLYPFPPSRLTTAEFEALNVLKDLPDGTVLTLPYDKNMRAKLSDPFPLFAYETTAYVSAFSGKSTFVEDEIQNEILQTDYRKRLAATQGFFQSFDRSFFANWGIRYVYLVKSKNIVIDPVILNLEKIYENSEVLIYGVKI